MRIEYEPASHQHLDEAVTDAMEIRSHGAMTSHTTPAASRRR
jgi:hypothetical protein